MYPTIKLFSYIAEFPQPDEAPFAHHGNMFGEASPGILGVFPSLSHFYITLPATPSSPT